MNKFNQFYVLVSCLGFISAADIRETRVCYKEKSHPDLEEILIAEGVDDFVELITQGNVWVDRSNLIKRILKKEDKRLYSITAPPKWGKSINLSMLKLFLEVPTDKEGNVIPIEDSIAYKYFTTGETPTINGSTDKIQKPPMISQESVLIVEKLGQFAIVYLNFTGVEVKKDNTTIKEKIIGAFEPHANFVNKHAKLIKEEELKRFNQIRSGEVNIEELADSIKFLSMILYKCYEKEVIVLFDSYDAIVNDLYFNPDVKLPYDKIEVIEHFYWNFISNFTIDNNYLHKAIFTGILRLNFEAKYDIAEYNMALRTNLYPFYGFLAEDVTSLMKLRRLGLIMRDRALSWYGGYNVMLYKSEQIFSPSVTRFLNSRSVGSFWVPSPQAEFIFRLIKDTVFAAEIKAVKDKTELNDMKQLNLRSLSFYDLYGLKTAILSQRLNDPEVVMNVLNQMGYLTIADFNVPKSPSQVLGTFLNLAAPNKEIVVYFDNQLKRKV